MRLLNFFVLFLLVTSINAQELRVVSWNIKDLGQSRDDSEITMIANVIRDADVVAIQEVVAKHPGGAKAVARLADELNRMGSRWDYRISDPTNSTSPHKSERYAFLWKTSRVKLSSGRPYLVSGLAASVEREPYVATFAFGSETFTIVNYHACTHKSDYPERDEIATIDSWLTSLQGNVLFVGDMNLVQTDQVFTRLYNHGYTAALNDQKTSLKMKCKAGNYLSRAEDNIYYHLPSLSARAAGVLDFVGNYDCHEVSWKRNSLSDHLPVVLELSEY